MPPLDFKDWWLAAATATSLLSTPTGAAVVTGDRVGVATTARPGVRSISGEHVVYAGNDIFHGERLETDGTGALHILFMDQSSLTLGPNSAITIDEYLFRPERGEGSLQVRLLKGFLRVVGGLLSKHTDTRVQTRLSTIGIRGGITIVEADDTQTRSTFLFGQHMQVTAPSGQTAELVTRPGFSVVSSPAGLSAPMRVPVEEFVALLGRFESRFSAPAGGQAFMPRGRLISTQEGRDMGLSAPNRTLAPDRLDKVLDDLNNVDTPTSLNRVFNPLQVQS